MKARDEKLVVITEVLSGIRQIKFSALERAWESRVQSFRDRELAWLVKNFIVNIVMSASWALGPIFLTTASLCTYAIVNGSLTPSTAFTSIAIFKSLETGLALLPELFQDALACIVSANRMDEYLSRPEMERTVTNGPDIAFENASFAWPTNGDVSSDERFVLKGINLCFPSGELSVICGKTAAGKSLLLSAMLGEVDLLEGSIFMPRATAPLERDDGKANPGNWILAGECAYVAQTPWLESASFRDNILFGLPFFQSRYDTTLDVCALRPDLKTLIDGDLTELGVNGINLSGGQKWRVTLARAIYSRAEILILDDIFSAVDAHVGRQIFENCIAGEICRGRTRILVTHHAELVRSQTSLLVELADGTVRTTELVPDSDRHPPAKSMETRTQTEHEPSVDGGVSVWEEATGVQQPEIQGGSSTQKTSSNGAGKFIKDETRAKGNVKRHIYAAYLKASGGWITWSIAVLLFLSFQASIIGNAWWMRIWTGQSQQDTKQMAFREQHEYVFVATRPAIPQQPTANALVEHDVWFYLSIYVVIAIMGGVFGSLRFAWSFKMSIKASRVLFKKIVFTVIRAPLRWVDTVPVGRVLNRLTADFETIDGRLAFAFSNLILQVLSVVGISVAGMLVSVYILPLTFIMAAIATVAGYFFMQASRPIRRLESNARSPVFELFSSSLAGATTIRAYGKVPIFTERIHSRLDSWSIISYWTWLLGRWLGFWMSFLGSIFTTSVGMIIISTTNIDAAMAGFILSFALDFPTSMLMGLRAYSTLELTMNATERVVEYTELETEALGGEKPSAAWPQSGNVVVEDLVVAYAPELPPVLDGVSFNVKDKERVGVVGRTGAGKSSLTLSLFRFLEARSGRITIDGVDISKIDLECLRSRLAIIPQDPVLFSGTIRSNLDPFDNHTDQALHDCLSRVHLTDSESITSANESSSSASSALESPNANIFRDLGSGISEGGGNLSQGQRQLLCIARAIATRPKIMILDEATSSVDMATDALIQKSIREEFASSTLIVIAHRLSTIADFDKILVLSEGSVVEFGTPEELWHKDGMFRDLCNHSGEYEQLKKTILGA